MLRSLDHREGNVAKVIVYYPEEMGDNGLEFWLDVGEAIEILAEGEKQVAAARKVASHIAELLGYHVHEQE